MRTPLPPMAKQAQLLLVDDHAVIRDGLVSLFSTYSSMKVVGTACSGKTALEQAPRCRPNVVLTDLRLPDMTGIDVCREIRSHMPQTKVVILSAFLDDEAVLAAMVAGASGFVLKSCPEDQLTEAISSAAAGEAYLAGPPARSLLSFVRRAANCAMAQRPMPLYRGEKAALSRLDGIPDRSLLATLPFREYIGPSEWSAACAERADSEWDPTGHGRSA